MRRLLVRVLLLLVVLAWLAAAAVVMFVDPEAPSGALLDAPIGRSAVARVLGHDGYVHSWSVTTEGDGATGEERTTIVRGPLDREGGTFPLSLLYESSAPFQGLRLGVGSSDAALGSEEDWTWIGGSQAEPRGERWMATIEGAPCPAGRTAGLCRIQVLLPDGSRTDNAGTMPQAPTVLGRVHDTIGHWPIFRWLPKLR